MSRLIHSIIKEKEQPIYIDSKTYNYTWIEENHTTIGGETARKIGGKLITAGMAILIAIGGYFGIKQLPNEQSHIKEYSAQMTDPIPKITEDENYQYHHIGDRVYSFEHAQLYGEHIGELALKMAKRAYSRTEDRPYFSEAIRKTYERIDRDGNSIITLEEISEASAEAQRREARRY